MATIIRIGKTIKTLQFNYGKRIKEEESKGKDLKHLTEYYGFQTLKT
ncbi:hypothetical protein [Elizabethkingia meningoseptica]|nr:hypothetical protein [Elizabethkingia meningoseptica]